MTASQQPVLYSFRRCPYAIRARVAIAHSRIQVELREVVLKDKPEALFAASAKGTVPVLLLPQGRVIDESMDIMLWALADNTTNHWQIDNVKKHSSLIKENDSEFKHWLDRYKYADRFPEFSQIYYREQCEQFIETVDNILLDLPFLSGHHFGIVDAAIAPFIRQFSLVDKHWFAESRYQNIKKWLHQFINSPLFYSVMIKYAQWQSGDRPSYFP